MRQRLPIIITLVVVIVVLVALNAASYVRVEQEADEEGSPDRSTFNAGATGTRAFYDFLRESGHKVVHWRESSSSLLTSDEPGPDTLVIVGRTQVPYSRTDVRDILSWVESGGRLVIIDRMPDRRFLLNSKDWVVTSEVMSYPWRDIDPNNFEQMTTGVTALRPSQPTLMARNVESVMPSRFMGVITVSPNKGQPQSSPTPGPEAEITEEEYEDEESEETAEPVSSAANEAPSDDVSRAPVVHLKQERGAVLVDYPLGKGRVVLLSDPYIVANNGIGRADNLLLALNVVGRNGTIAFDEYHQGRAATHNAIVQYFSGTPILAICAQLGLIGLAIVWSRGRRFARPLPLPHVDRRSKLEFVASMAELQHRARAHDSRAGKIFTAVCGGVGRYAGVNNSSPRTEIARRVAMRSGLNQNELETLMRNCEDTINGAPTNAKESLQMVQQLREIESRLGLRTRSRDVRQKSGPPAVAGG